MVSTRPSTSESSRPFNNPLLTEPKAPITIGIIITFMFHSFFFNSIARSRYLSLFSHSFNFILWSAGTAKTTILQVLFFFFLLITIRSGLLADIRWSVCISKFHRSWCVPLLLLLLLLLLLFSFKWVSYNSSQNFYRTQMERKNSCIEFINLLNVLSSLLLFFNHIGIILLWR